MPKYDYNIIVIGGGAAGLVAAYVASAVKAKVALVEQSQMGGDCLNSGCVPSKALLKSAKVFRYAKQGSEFGFSLDNLQLDFTKVMQRVKDKVQKVAPHDSVERYSKLGVDCIHGYAKIISPHKVSVAEKVISAKSIIVATGAQPLVPPIPGLMNLDYLTSDNIWNLKELPKNLVILGGGPIGIEIAQAFTTFGSNVTVVEMAKQILVREDQQVIEYISNKFQQAGIKILTEHKAISFDGNKLICEHRGQNVEIKFEKVFVALGRKANISGFGLEELGVKFKSPPGIIEANNFLATNIPNIYVCGDALGPYQFTHVAAHQAWFACINALFSPYKKFKIDYNIIPWATYTDPEIARVGLNEKEALAKKIPYEVTWYDIGELDRAIVDSQDSGFIKVLTVPNKDRILGVIIVGEHAADIICEFILAMKHNIGLNGILKTIHIYPTFAEANKYVAGIWKMQHAPLWALNILEKFHKWRRG